MKLWSCLLAVFVPAVSIHPKQCHAALLNTGFNSGNSILLANDARDTNWTFVSTPDSSFLGVSPVVRVSPLAGGWLADNASTTSRWIVAGVPGNTSLNDAPGLWTLQTSVVLASVDATTMINGLQYAADNKVVLVMINGSAVFSQTTAFAEEFKAWHVIGDVGTGLFHPGTNVIQFELLNQTGLNSPLALRVEGSITPEPAGIGFIGLFVGSLFWRKRKGI